MELQSHREFKNSNFDARLRRKYEQDGVLSIDLNLESHLIEQVKADTLAYFPCIEAAPIKRVQDAWQNSFAIKKLALHERVLSLLRFLYKREPLPFQTLNFPVGTQQPAHSDTIHFNSEPAGLMCGVWVALEDIDAGNGPLVYYPGTHKLPELKMHHINCRAETAEYRKYEVHIQKMIMTAGWTPKYGLVKKGTCIIWAANLLHGGALQLEPGRTRLSQVTHYFMSGYEYLYTPMLSPKGQPKLRNPCWIS
jgi:hypothetical protein